MKEKVYEISWKDDEEDHVVWIKSPFPIVLVPGHGKDGMDDCTGIYVRETSVPLDAAGIDFKIRVPKGRIR